jgi:large subunit ribosomal protein L25
VVAAFCQFKELKMAADFELSAELRTDMGKGASRRLRRKADQIPAVIYGAGREPQSLTMAHKDLAMACENEAFYSHVLTLTIDGEKQSVIIKDLQRHPAKPRIMHADFLRVQMDHLISVEVPLHFLNEELCVGVKLGGGQISHNMSQVEISCLPGALPEFIEVDLTDLELGQAVHMSEINLPEGVTIPALTHGADYDQVVASVHLNKRAELELEEGEEEASDVDETETGTEGESEE